MYSYFAKTVTHEEMIERGPDLETSSLIHWTENILNTIVTITIITIITTTITIIITIILTTTRLEICQKIYTTEDLHRKCVIFDIC